MLHKETVHKKCIVCGVRIKGRSDKKFCTDYCRNTHNNSIHKSSTNQIRNITNALRRNRRILESIMKKGKGRPVKKAREELVRLGLQFKYITHHLALKPDKTCYFCYDYGYLELKPEEYLIVKEKDALQA
jgi:predicted nucleic acid-binding Zn ribbon protein